VSAGKYGEIGKAKNALNPSKNTANRYSNDHWDPFEGGN